MVLTALTLALTAHAGPATTRDALDRMEELLQVRLEEGTLQVDDIVPAIIVAAQPRYEDSAPWFTTEVAASLSTAFGSAGLRLCEACMVPRTWVEDGQMLVQSGPVSLEEVARLDASSRGTAPAARAAIWVEEHRGGVAIRIVDLGTSRVVYAQNVDPGLTQRMYTLAEEYERRARGDSLTQAFVDIAVYPGQHIALDWTDQWGQDNGNLSGVTLSLVDPVVGIGAVHYRRIKLANSLIGAKLIVSLPTAIVRSVGDFDVDVLDNLVTGVAVVRVPFGRSNYGAVATLSSNGAFGLGVSLMNISLLPVIP